MSLIKRAVSVALCTAILAGFAACGGKDNGNKGTGNGQPSIGETASENQAVSKIQEKTPENITDRDIYMANTVDYLLSIYKSIRITCEYADSSIIKYMFLKDGKPFYIEDNRPAESESEIWCWYNGMSFSPNGSRVRAYFSAEELPDVNSDFPYRYMISDNVTGEVVEYVGESDGCYEFRVTGTDEEIHYVENHFFDKETLAVKKSICRYDDEELNEIYFDYDTPVEYALLIDGWDGELKKVTVVSEIIGDSGSSVITKEYSIPADWEMLPYEYEEVAIYLDKDMTVPYEYPGDGVDYTIYVTNTMG
ncbi:MAG: hypothetical protein ACI4JG_04300 [Acutalibacteraceae bacterium]